MGRKNNNTEKPTVIRTKGDAVAFIRNMGTFSVVAGNKTIQFTSSNGTPVVYEFHGSMTERYAQGRLRAQGEAAVASYVMKYRNHINREYM